MTQTPIPATGGEAAPAFPAKLTPLTREVDTLSIQVRAEEGKPTKLTFAASSEAPVERWFGSEILSHAKGAVRMDRVDRGAVPLLFNHNWDDPIGMVDAARLEDKRLVVDAHLFDTARAREISAMVNGGLKNVSLMYRIHVVEENKDEETYTARDWEPFEVSIVTIPADPTVGIDRKLGQELEVRMLCASPDVSTPKSAQAAKGAVAMSDKDTAAAGANADQSKAEQERVEREAREKLETRSALDLEQARKRAIENLAKGQKIPDNIRDAWVNQGYSVEQVSNDLLRILEERGKSNPQPASVLGLSGAETQRFSLMRAINAVVHDNWKEAGFELECSRQLAQKLGKVVDPKRFLVPFEVLQRNADMSQFSLKRMAAAMGRRDLTVATAGAGGYLVETENVGFVEMVRNRSVAFRMGARRLNGLVGSVTIPRQSAAATAVWLANEASTATESQQTFVQIALSPKTVSGYTEISRQLTLQSSPAAEGIVTDDLAQVVAIAADLGVLEGSGAGGQPTGISGTAGIGSVTGTSLAAAGIIEFQTDVASANVQPVAGGYVTTPAVAGLLMVRPELPSTGTTRLWRGNVWDGNMFDLPAMTSNQLTAATMIFGDWQEVVVAEWGVLEVEVNPYANFQAGIIGVRALYSMDVGVRRPFAFSRATSIT